MIAIILQVMWTIMAVLLTKNYYDNSSYRWAVINFMFRSSNRQVYTV